MDTAKDIIPSSLIYEVLDPIIFKMQTHDIDQVSLIINDAKQDRLLRSGEAVLLLDQATKEELQIDAQFKPSLKARPAMSESEFTATDTEVVLKALEKTRDAERMPLPSNEGQFQCCHREYVKRGTGRDRKSALVRCKNLAVVNDLRCPIHLGTSVAKQKDIQHLLVSEEEKKSERVYHVMKGVQITLLASTESLRHRHPMSMAPPDLEHAKDYALTRKLVTQFQELYQKIQKHEKCPQPMKFPEGKFVLDYGGLPEGRSWEQVYEWVKFSVEELAHGQDIQQVTDWNLWTEFWYKQSKSYGWMQFTAGASEFLPESKDSWVQDTKPRPVEYNAVYYNYEAPTNNERLYDYTAPVSIKKYQLNKNITKTSEAIQSAQANHQQQLPCLSLRRESRCETQCCRSITHQRNSIFQ